MTSKSSRVDISWAFLSGELERRRVQCQEWCQAMDIPMDFAAALGHTITSVPYKSEVAAQYLAQNVPSERVLPKVPLASDWTMLSSWKHPQFHLNLFQLAVIFNNAGALQYLVRHSSFTDAENYEDGSGELVNHPLHLAYCVSKNPRELLRDVFEDFPQAPLCKKGTVDLCNLGSTPKSMETEADTPSTAGAVADASESPSETLLLRQVKIVAEDSITAEAFLNPTTITLLPLPVRCDVDMAFSLLLLVYRKILVGKAQFSTVEDFEKIFSSLCAEDISESSYNNFLEAVDGEATDVFMQDTLHLAVLLVWAVNSASLGEEPVRRISRLFLRTRELGQDCLTAARCLPTDLLQRVMQVISGTGIAVVQSIQNLWLNKNLQDLSTHAILHIVRGDVYKIWNMNMKDMYPKFIDYLPYPFIRQRWDLNRAANQVLVYPMDELSD